MTAGPEPTFTALLFGIISKNNLPKEFPKVIQAIELAFGSKSGIQNSLPALPYPWTDVQTLWPPYGLPLLFEW